MPETENKKCLSLTDSRGLLMTSWPPNTLQLKNTIPSTVHWLPNILVSLTWTNNRLNVAISKEIWGDNFLATHILLWTQTWLIYLYLADLEKQLRTTHHLAFDISFSQCDKLKGEIVLTIFSDRKITFRH